MHHSRYACITSVGLVTLLSAASAPGVGMNAQRIVVRRCVAVLPPQLSPFFESRAADLEERVIEPDGVWRRERETRGRTHWGHLRIDVKAQNESTSARLAAAEAFPRREAEAKQLFRSLGLGRRGGRLPWVIEDLHAELVSAFEQGDEDEIIKAAGHLAHFAWAASQPFNVTMDHDGRDTGNLYLGALDVGDPYYAHQSVRYRVAGEMVRRYRNRYLERVQVRPRELQPISDPLEPCFRHMLGSLARLEDLLTADREITERLGAKDGASLVRREDEYYELLDARCGDIMVERLGSAAMLAADLIVGAWECAGRTALGHQESPDAATPAVILEAKPDEAPQDKPDAAEKAGSKVEYVGSRNSSVFHRSDCPHVKRISPSNLVHYESAEDAKRQGKRPCRMCLPE